jgi:hypothetical protein
MRLPLSSTIEELSSPRGQNNVPFAELHRLSFLFATLHIILAAGSL